MHFEQAVVASKNPDKIEEVEAVLAALGVVGEIVRGRSWPDVDETADTLAGNARLKAAAVAAATGLVAIADDTGLFVSALDGRPGIHAARYAGRDATYADNVALLLRELEGVQNRAASFRTAVVARHPAGREWVVQGSLDGRIIDVPRGEGGFGYDPVFEVDGRTLAEMTPDEKHALSHRARALRALGKLLAGESSGGVSRTTRP